jgi:type IV pilus assembly protein PilB
MNSEDHLNSRLGSILVKAGVISQDTLQVLLSKQQEVRKRLGELAIEEGAATEEQIGTALSQQMGIPFLSLEATVIDPVVVGLISEAMARDLVAIPLFRVENRLTVAMADPTNSEAIKEIRFVTGCEIEPVIARQKEIVGSIESYYGMPGTLVEAMEELNTKIGEGPEDTSQEDILESEKLSNEAPVVKLVNLIIERAVDKRASDIHSEPEENCLRVRYRVDGVLQETMVIPRMLRAAVTSRFKILANVNIAERRIPQDGRFSMRIKGRRFDVRVSTFPTIHGEKVVMRLLERCGATIPLEELGMSENVLKTFSQVLGLTHGIVLVTGPTGSGKSTTLYAALNRINTPDKNIVTLEDPVESQIQGINQGHTNPTAGFTFSAGLRSILRQDPDIIMVGETRDVETSEIAIQAALTGHLVFTTVHTNDSVSAITRLIDMGIEPFLVASSVSAILAQRLVRKVCRTCASNADPEEIMVPDTGEARRLANLLKAEGCEKCSKSGYSGRVGLYELVVINDEMRRIITNGADEQALKREARASGYRTMFEDGLDKCAAGITTLEEVMRVTRTVLEDDLVAPAAVVREKSSFSCD